MCGIIGYAGDKEACGFLINGLKRLEYRGYDSAGIALSGNKALTVIKSEGRISKLENIIDNTVFDTVSSSTGIGHTRWATHGEPSDINAHPQLSSDGNFAVVHNGIIENYISLKNELIKDGYVFSSQTDTEVIPALLQKYYSGDVLYALNKTCRLLKGSFAICVICRDFPDKIYCQRFSSPLIIGKGESESFAASDITAFLNHTGEFYRLFDFETAVISREAIEFYDKNLNRIKKTLIHSELNPYSAEKNSYKHYMLKEIYEQPQVIKETLSSYITDGKIDLSTSGFDRDTAQIISDIHIVACGSAYHVGLTGKYVIESICRIPVQADIASEFRYRNPVLDKHSLVIIISQSGETADSLAALREAKKKNAAVLSIVNVHGSSIAEESDFVLYTCAGPEIAVATTKAYSAQLCLIYLTALFLSQIRGELSESQTEKYLNELFLISSKVNNILSNQSDFSFVASLIKNAEHAYFIGRSLDLVAAAEGSLKLKEISYIHSEAYGAGEMKHGTISLIEKGTVVIALACCDKVFSKTLSNIKEVISRGAKVICISTEKHRNELKDCEAVITVPEASDIFCGSLSVIPLQLVAYYTAKERNCDIDKPRNLAKSVTVE